jgi:Protein of unknown function (DUF1186)/SEC-C motif
VELNSQHVAPILLTVANTVDHHADLDGASVSSTMEQYDALKAPDPQEWLALDESERIELAQDYHRRGGIHPPDEAVHAMLHATVESQIALGDGTPVRRTVARLTSEGLDRHEAVHAIGLVLVEHMNDLLSNSLPEADPNQHYYAAVERLTAEDWLRSADESDEHSTEVVRILDGLAAPGPLPVEAIRDAQANQELMAPAFVQVVEECLSAKNAPSIHGGLFFIFHLLGEWREKSAYRPLAKLLCRPADEVDSIFGGAITETSHRVMASVFDGDPQPLYDVILDPDADEFIRSRMCEALAMVTLRDELPRAEAMRFLRACYSNIKPQDECYVWDGWQSAIAMLGVVELKPFVEQAFRSGYISPSSLSFEDFEKDLQRAIDGSPPPSWQPPDEYDLFGDTIDELSDWYCFSPEYRERGEREPRVWAEQRSPQEPAVNQFKGVGRNDSCPCGSGKKFKKCCLNSARDGGDLSALLS